MKEDIENIKARNKRVESDKAWEVSIMRRLIVALMTYIIMILFLSSINAPRPWLNALVPTLGFILSTLTLPFFKSFWLNNIYKS